MRSEIPMSAVRSRIRSIATRASARARGAPGAGVDAAPERQVLAGVGAGDVERRRVVEVARVPARGAVEHHHGGSAESTILV
jgi:hypothetical protein